jgi:hypothetical protein
MWGFLRQRRGAGERNPYPWENTIERVSDRQILYTSAVERALALCAERMPQQKPPRSAS